MNWNNLIDISSDRKPFDVTCTICGNKENIRAYQHDKAIFFYCIIHESKEEKKQEMNWKTLDELPENGSLVWVKLPGEHPLVRLYQNLNNNSSNKTNNYI